MNRKEELEYADRAIKDAEQRLRSVKNSLDAVEKEFDTLTNLKKELEANVKFLKKKNIIALAAEFKKAKEDLAKTKSRLSLISKDRDNIRKIFHDMELAIYNAKQAYNERLQEIDNNVIRGNFGRKNG